MNELDGKLIIRNKSLEVIKISQSNQKITRARNRFFSTISNNSSTHLAYHFIKFFNSLKKINSGALSLILANRSCRELFSPSSSIICNTSNIWTYKKIVYAVSSSLNKYYDMEKNILWNKDAITRINVVWIKNNIKNILYKMFVFPKLLNT